MVFGTLTTRLDRVVSHQLKDFRVCHMLQLFTLHLSVQQKFDLLRGLQQGVECRQIRDVFPALGMKFLSVA